MVKDTDCAAIVRGKNERRSYAVCRTDCQSVLRAGGSPLGWAMCDLIICRHLVVRKQKTLFPHAEQMRGGAVNGVGGFAAALPGGTPGVFEGRVALYHALRVLLRACHPEGRACHPGGGLVAPPGHRRKMTAAGSGTFHELERG